MRKALSHLNQRTVKVSTVKKKKSGHNHDPVGYQGCKEITWMQVLFCIKKLTCFDNASVPDEHGMLSKLNRSKS